MKHRETVLSTVLAVVCLATPALGQPASAGRAPDGSPAPRTSWGTPDLTGVWDHGTATPLERPERYEGREFLTAEEIAEANVNATTFATSERRGELSAERDVGLAYNQFWWDRGVSDGRTALIIDPPDGKIPYMDGVDRGGRRQRGYDGPESRGLWERCMTRGAVRLGGVYNNNFQLFQTENYVAILLEMVHEIRIIPLDGSSQTDHSPSQWLGSSHGHWEGDTLVVETTDFSGQSPWRGSGDNLHLIERFSRPDADTLRYEVTFEDPTTWTGDWTAALDMPKTDGLMYEYACHERNYGMENLLKGARALEREAGAQ